MTMFLSPEMAQKARWDRDMGSIRLTNTYLQEASSRTGR